MRFVWLPGARQAVNLAQIVTVHFDDDYGNGPSATVTTTAIDADWPTDSASGPRPWTFYIRNADVKILHAALFESVPEGMVQP